MKLISRSVMVALATLLATMSMAAADVIPADPNVRTGKLSNGLTYYVLHNNFPAQHADFFIAQRVGSVQETEKQRGLAHFLEHMCFNGTEHFPGNSLIEYMESIGVKFGANLNAYTSTDETVYNICNVPTTRQGIIDSCMMVLGDWGHGLTLDGKEIDRERGVIEGEWRMRTGANYRILEKAGPELYPGCIYGERMPIGLMSVVKNFKHKELRNYYKQWYHPSNQCIIVVGDIDPDQIVASIKATFGKVKNPSKAPRVTPVAVPDNEEIITSIHSDHEQPTTSVRLLFKHAGLSDSEMQTTAYLRNEYLKSVVSSMLRARFAEQAQLPDAPFTQAMAADRDYFLSKTCQAFQVIATARSGKADQTMRWIAQEVHRVASQGFTEGEYTRARLNYESSLNKLYRERDSYSNTEYARGFVRAYLDGEPIPSIEDNCRLMREQIEGITLRDVNMYVYNLVSTSDRNVVLVTFAPDDETLPTREELINAYHDGMNTDLPPYVDNYAGNTLLTTEPTAGTITSETPVEALDAQLWTLSNGMRLYVKPTTVKAGEVVIAGYAPGGYSINYKGAEDAPSFKAFNSVMASQGYGQFNNTTLKKALAGKDVKMRTSVSKTAQAFQGASATSDLETALQLLYLKLTQPQKDEAAFATFIEGNRQRIEKQGNDPKFEFADSIFANVYDHHPLGAEKLTTDELDKVSLDRILDVYRDRFSDLSQMSIYIVGDVNLDSLRPLVCRYLASLPAAGRSEKPRDIDYHLFTQNKDVAWSAPMTTAQDKDYCFWTSQCPYNLRNVLLARITGQVFTNIFREQLREDRGWTYHVDTHCSVVPDLNGSDQPVIFMPLNVTVTAGKGAETHRIIADDIADVAANGITTERLDKVKKSCAKSTAKTCKTTPTGCRCSRPSTSTSWTSTPPTYRPSTASPPPTSNPSSPATSPQPTASPSP